MAVPPDRMNGPARHRKVWGGQGFLKGKVAEVVVPQGPQGSQGN